MQAQGHARRVVLLQGVRVELNLFCDGATTTLSVQVQSGGGLSSSSSSVSSGVWTNQPMASTDGRSRIAILVQGQSQVAAFAAQIGAGGTAVASSSMDRATFERM